jgi:hypothetical protein
MQNNPINVGARPLRACGILVAIAGLSVGCTPLQPGPSTELDDDVNTNGMPAARFAVFEDPDSDFSTDQVRDVDGEIMQFDNDSQMLVWQLDGSTHAGWPVSANDLGATGSFRVRFGTEGGEPRAYFTETGPATICDLEVTNGVLSIFPTTTTVPQS